MLDNYLAINLVPLYNWFHKIWGPDICISGFHRGWNCWFRSWEPHFESIAGPFSFHSSDGIDGIQVRCGRAAFHRCHGPRLRGNGTRHWCGWSWLSHRDGNRDRCFRRHLSGHGFFFVSLGNQGYTWSAIASHGKNPEKPPKRPLQSVHGSAALSFLLRQKKQRAPTDWPAVFACLCSKASPSRDSGSNFDTRKPTKNMSLQHALFSLHRNRNKGAGHLECIY